MNNLEHARPFRPHTETPKIPDVSGEEDDSDFVADAEDVDDEDTLLGSFNRQDQDNGPDESMVFRRDTPGRTTSMDAAQIQQQKAKETQRVQEEYFFESGPDSFIDKMSLVELSTEMSRLQDEMDQVLRSGFFQKNPDTLKGKDAVNYAILARRFDKCVKEYMNKITNLQIAEKQAKRTSDEAVSLDEEIN